MVKRKTESLAALEQRLGHHFKEARLAEQALTHGSSGKRGATYERLEFLGDRVLALVVAEALFRNHGREREGKLAARHSALVRGEVCAEVAETLGLGEFLHVGATEKKQGVQHMRSVLGDVMEALIGAVYLDAGFQAAEAVVLKHWKTFLERADTATKDAKTFVQEWALSRGKALPIYELLAREGPEHKPQFTVRITVPMYGEALGKGASKQAAEMAAAQQFIAAGNLR